MKTQKQVSIVIVFNNHPRAAESFKSKYGAYIHERLSGQIV